jgi:hypothetical protein
MMKTALSIVQSVCRRINHPVPSTLISVTDPDEIQMIELLVAVCEELRQARCWTQLKRSYSFNTVASQATYQLPQDYYSPLLRTHWNADEDLRLAGPESDDDYVYLKESGASSPVNYTFRLFGRDENPASNSGQFQITPTPSGVDTLKFEYITRSFFLPKNWTASTSFTAASYCNASGNIYKKASAGTETSGATVPSHTTGTVTDGTITWTYQAESYETVLADTDLVIFDDDLVKLGLRAKLLEDRGGEFEGPAAEFQAKIDRAMARYKGSFVGAFGGRSSGSRYKVQSGNWSI